MAGPLPTPPPIAQTDLGALYSAVADLVTALQSALNDIGQNTLRRGDALTLPVVTAASLTTTPSPPGLAVRIGTTGPVSALVAVADTATTGPTRLAIWDYTTTAPFWRFVATGPYATVA